MDKEEGERWSINYSSQLRGGGGSLFLSISAMKHEEDREGGKKKKKKKRFFPLQNFSGIKREGERTIHPAFPFHTAKKEETGGGGAETSFL